LGLINPKLYSLGTLQYGASAINEGFHDITSGDNNFHGVNGFSAGTGYDKASGLGSVDFGTFRTAFETAPTAPPTTMTATPSSIDFGSLDASSISRPKKVVIKNTGTNNAMIGAVAISGTNSGDFTITSNNCSSQTIKPKHSCTIMVEFSPPTPIGAESASLDVPFNGGPVSTSLTGNSTAVTVTVTPTSITFSPAPAGGTSAPKFITLTNTSKTASVSLGAIGGPFGPFTVTSDGCSNKSLGHGKRCKIKVASKPPPGSASKSTTNGGIQGPDFTYGTNDGQTGFIALTGEVK
jgi:hypothetical protein